MLVRDLWVRAQAMHNLGDTDFARIHFLEALNSIRADVNSRFKQVFTEVAASDISANTDLAWGEHYDNAIRAGLKHYLMVSGAYAADPDPEAEGFYMRQLSRAMIGAIKADGTLQTRNQPETAA